MKRKLESDDKFCLVVGKSKFEMSRSLLIKKSLVFEAMFESGMNETSTNELIITDFSQETVELLVECLQLNGMDAEVGGNHLRELIKLTSKYQIPSVLNQAVQRTILHITEDNLVSDLIFADKYGANKLKTSCFDFICKFPQVLTQTNFSENLGGELSSELFSFLSTKLPVQSACRTRVKNPSQFSVEISGAPLEYVNGRYNFSCTRHGAGQYEKFTSIFYRIQCLVLYKAINSNEAMSWFIAKIDGQFEPVVDVLNHDDILYFADSDADCRTPTIDLLWEEAGRVLHDMSSDVILDL